MTAPRDQATITPSLGAPGVQPPGLERGCSRRRVPASPSWVTRGARGTRVSDNRFRLKKPAAGWEASARSGRGPTVQPLAEEQPSRLGPSRAQVSAQQGLLEDVPLRVAAAHAHELRRLSPPCSARRSS